MHGSTAARPYALCRVSHSNRAAVRTAAELCGHMVQCQSATTQLPRPEDRNSFKRANSWAE
jgi:hypothetical protein